MTSNNNLPNPGKHHFPPEMQPMRPRLTLNFDEELNVRYDTHEISGIVARCSLAQGEEAALRHALAALPITPCPSNTVVECWLPLRDVRISRGMAGAKAVAGRINAQQVNECITRACEAALVSKNWGGTRVWGDIAEIIIDGMQADVPMQNISTNGNHLHVEVLEAFCVPEFENARNAVLQAYGLDKPTWQNLSIVGNIEAFTTTEERQGGIAVLYIDGFGAELGICVGGHVVSLTNFSGPPNDPARLMLDVDSWLQHNGWNIQRLPNGIRVLGHTVNRERLAPIVNMICLPVTFPNIGERGLPCHNY